MKKRLKRLKQIKICREIASSWTEKKIFDKMFRSNNVIQFNRFNGSIFKVAIEKFPTKLTRVKKLF